MKYVKRHSRVVSLLAVLLVVTIGSLSLAAAVRPSRGTTVSSWSEMISASPFSQNYVIDQPRLWLPTAGNSQLAVATLAGIGAGDPLPTEVNSAEVGGMFLDTDADSVSWFFMLPPDIDLSKNITVNVVHSNSEAAAVGGIKYTCLYEWLVVGTTAVGLADDAFDTDGGSIVDLAANVVQIGPDNVINGATITGTPGDDMMLLKCAVTLDTCADSTVYGAYFKYHRKFMGGGGSY